MALYVHKRALYWQKPVKETEKKKKTVNEILNYLLTLYITYKHFDCLQASNCLHTSSHKMTEQDLSQGSGLSAKKATLTVNFEQ